MNFKQKISFTIKARQFFPWRRTGGWAIAAGALFIIGLFSLSEPVVAQSNIAVTRHNLSNSNSITGAVKASNETQICAFCHTPHNANTAAVKAPLWNRNTNIQTYTRYTSSSLDANNIADGFNDQPGGSSLLCLSCHDGTVAIGNVNVFPKNTGTLSTDTSIAMSGPTDSGKIPVGYGVNTGFTRLGTDLTNDHPISITYNDTLAQADGELARLDASQRDTGTGGALIGIRSSGYKPLLPLERTGPVGVDGLKQGQVQCATCHDPHLNKSKFLRLNRLQTNAGPTGGSFSQANDIICLACHTKLGAAWSESAHARETVADETYTAAAAALRSFPDGSNTKVWQAACLNCHDSHTVQGSRRLLREGVGVAAGQAGATDITELTVATGPAAGAAYQPGVNPNAGDNNVTSSIETTCFQCHRNSGGANAITAANGTVPSIKSLFDLPYGMPNKSDDQADPVTGGKERHNITNADLLETPQNLGRGDKTARHAECPDCHNPHRLRRNSKFYGSSTNGLGDTTVRTHQPGVTIAGTAGEGNVASGVLRGGWGVQPVFTGGQTSLRTRVWPQNPDSYEVKKGDPGNNTSTGIDTSTTYLTREYQLCFKCHSDYSNGPLKTDFQDVGYASVVRSSNRRGTPQTMSNGMKIYTNVAAEFSSVNAGLSANGFAVTGTDQGEQTNSGTACGDAGTADCVPNGSNDGSASYGGTNINHRSWHPVMFPTGRDRVERGMSTTGSTNIRPPFLANMGKQTMQCNDCHGQGSSWQQGVGPIATQPQGPHGSSYPFLLRGDWSASTTKIGSSLATQICGYCHNPGSGSTGFSGSGVGNHGSGLDVMKSAPCMNCHIAVPHGWKNKAFLVNRNCVGQEAASATVTIVGDCASQPNGWTAQNLPPYYNSARLRIASWARSGNWSESSCNGMKSSCN